MIIDIICGRTCSQSSYWDAWRSSRSRKSWKFQWCTWPALQVYWAKDSDWAGCRKGTSWSTRTPSSFRSHWVCSRGWGRCRTADSSGWCWLACAGGPVRKPSDYGYSAHSSLGICSPTPKSRNSTCVPAPLVSLGLSSGIFPHLLRQELIGRSSSLATSSRRTMLMSLFSIPSSRSLLFLVTDSQSCPADMSCHSRI